MKLTKHNQLESLTKTFRNIIQNSNIKELSFNKTNDLFSHSISGKSYSKLMGALKNNQTQIIQFDRDKFSEEFKKRGRNVEFTDMHEPLKETLKEHIFSIEPGMNDFVDFLINNHCEIYSKNTTIATKNWVLKIGEMPEPVIMDREYTFNVKHDAHLIEAVIAEMSGYKYDWGGFKHPSLIEESRAYHNHFYRQLIVDKQLGYDAVEHVLDLLESIEGLYDIEIDFKKMFNLFISSYRESATGRSKKYWYMNIRSPDILELLTSVFITCLYHKKKLTYSERYEFINNTFLKFIRNSN